jgi:hypothetical protein
MSPPASAKPRLQVAVWPTGISLGQLIPVITGVWSVGPGPPATTEKDLVNGWLRFPALSMSTTVKLIVPTPQDHQS